MTLRIERITQGDVALFERIAPDVFDEPVRPERLQAYLAQPTNRLLLAIEERPDGDLVVGQCAAVLHLHPDKVKRIAMDTAGEIGRLFEQSIRSGRLSEDDLFDQITRYLE